MTTTRDLLVSLLRDAGVERLVGAEPLGDLPHVACEDPDLACLLADADGRVNGGFGAALLAGPILHVSSRIGGTAPMQTVGSADDLVEVLGGLDPGAPPATFAIHLDLDLDEPVDELPARPEPQRGVVVTLDPSLAEMRLAIVVGPGVVRAGSTDRLLDMANAMGCAVVNTVGAKGVFRWDSPFHAGTAGLQARDWELAGVTDADLVVLSGLDHDEVPPGLFRTLVTQEVDPGQLAALALRWERPESEPQRPPLYEAIAGVVRPLYEDGSAPVTAARAALHLSGACPEGGVVVGDADLAGFWLGRAFPTGIPGSVVVAPTKVDGAAVAGALMARAAGRSAIAVTAQMSPAALELVGIAERGGMPVAVQEWVEAEAGEGMDPSAHVELSQGQFEGARMGVERLGVRLDPAALVEVAGPIDPRYA